ncbi:ExeA family protein [Inmirania thermothiophila]|uniref:MSHA biogenesis protein MshM n=1 Tax=Inmirania thermothiophila TaxID=1750597 RepID=A0A3N1Y5X3_9GAMM|nr:AAA family ATPase [Inmirania thermothiophila]ROR34205.1 MSHA biogenesis protein MshM [Inmirania thermothiophila]
MYEAHFGLREPPFRLTPDTGYYYNTAGHQEALNVLLVALAGGEGFVKISGEVGTGKTLLCRLLLARLEAPFESAYLPNPALSPAGLYHAIAAELGLSLARNLGQHRVLAALTEALVARAAAGRRVVLVVDEAQAMPPPTLEALRLLTNLETEREKLLQVVLFGQPELDRVLAEPGLRQLRQRITFSYRIPTLDRAGVEGYLRHRLTVAGWDGPGTPFDRAALRMLARASGGIPRLVNILAHKSMMLAYGRGRRRVGVREVRAAVRDTEGAVRRRRPALPWAVAGGAVAAAAAGLGAAYAWGVLG